MRGRCVCVRNPLGPAAALPKSDRRVTLGGVGRGRDLAKCDSRVTPRAAAPGPSRPTPAEGAAGGVDGALHCGEVHVPMVCGSRDVYVSAIFSMRNIPSASLVNFIPDTIIRNRIFQLQTHLSGTPV